MGALDSNLSPNAYQFDNVVAISYAETNSLWLQRLSRYHGDSMTAYYLVENGQSEYYYANFTEDFGDPFAIPHGTPVSDPRIQKLPPNFYAYRATPGISRKFFQQKMIPNPLWAQTNVFLVRSINKSFELVQLITHSDGSQEWQHFKQEEDQRPWTAQADTRVKVEQETLDAYWDRLPEFSQQKITSLGKEYFHVRRVSLYQPDRLTINLPVISGLDKSSPAGEGMYNFFMDYFNFLEFEGLTDLGFVITTNTLPQPAYSTIPSDITAAVAIYQGGSTGQQYQDLTTVNFEMNTAGCGMRSVAYFPWNWMDAGDETRIHGVSSIRRDVFLDFLRARHQAELPNICKAADVYVKIHCFEASELKIDFEEADADDIGPVVGDIQPTGKKVPWRDWTEISYHNFSNKDSDSSKKWCGPAHFKSDVEMLYTAFSNLMVKDNQIMVTADLTANVDLNLEGDQAKGDFGRYKQTAIYTMEISDKGQVSVVKKVNPLEDLSGDIDWSDFNNRKETQQTLQNIQSRLQGYLKGYMKTFEDDLEKYLNSSQGFVFPGGYAFSFQNLTVSNYGDLVSDILVLSK